MVVLIFLPWEQTKLQIAKKYQMYLVTKIKQLAIPMCKVRSSLSWENMFVLFSSVSVCRLEMSAGTAD